MNTTSIINCLPLIFLICLLFLLPFLYETFKCQALDSTSPDTNRAADGVHYESLSDIKTYLRENGWVSEKVDDDLLEYELLLAEQLASTSSHISPELLIAQIAKESRFDPNCEYKGAIGLMQIIPKYHVDKLEYIYDGDVTFDLWYDPRYSIMVGLMYMDELMGDDYACGDTAYALMMYNQGEVSATKTYLGRGIVSEYASSIISLKRSLEEIVQKGDVVDGEAG